MGGLSLVGHVNSIDSPCVITEARSGESDGRLTRLRLIRGTRLEHERIEETDLLPQRDSQWLSYDLTVVANGYYAAESTNDERVTFFEVRDGSVGWITHDEKQAIRRIRRAG
jgi:hypothetical protein